MATLRFDEMAQLDLLEAILFYESERPGHGRKFESEVDALIEMLLAHPSCGKNVDGYPPEVNAQALFLTTFPFVLIALQVEGELVVYAVADSRRPPEHYEERIRRRLE